MRYFNTTGPVDARDHYCLPPLERLDLLHLLNLIRQKRYFVLHAPRQTGKTSCLFALRDHLNGSGDYRCVYLNVEMGQSARDDVDAAMRAILGELATWAEEALDDAFVRRHWLEILDQHGPHGALAEILGRWSANDPRPLILLVDEIDALVGDTLISVLRQFRAGYVRRPAHFPQSVILCGVRDVRDYRIHSASNQAIITGGSAFNIKAESLRLGDFAAPDVTALFAQHTADTGQIVEQDALERIWHLTCGQPWLVNALGYEACFRLPEGLDRGRPITATLIQQAKENLILRRDTHLDQLADKLEEERVHRVVAPLLAGVEQATGFRKDDVAYAVDLGLIRQDIGGAIHIANPIYQEVIPRELSWDIQSGMSVQRTWYIDADGRLNMAALLRGFQQFFREHSAHWVERFQYREAGPQLLLQAYLQRVVNGGGRIEREYGLGRRRTDLLVIWPHSGGEQRIVLELKVRHRSLDETIREGLEQTRDYLDTSGAEAGHLVIFDRTPDKPWEEKLFQREETLRGKTVSVWGM